MLRSEMIYSLARAANKAESSAIELQQICDQLRKMANELDRMPTGDHTAETMAAIDAADSPAD